MKIAIEDNDGNVTTFGNVAKFAFNYYRGALEDVEFTPLLDADGAECVKYTGDNARAALVDFFGLEAVKKGKRIPKSAIRNGDLIRMIDHSTPPPGERDYKTIEYVATANGDDGYQFSAGEKFYLIDRPEPELPTVPGSVVRVHLKDGGGVRKIALGNDGLWRGQDIYADADMLKRHAETVEVIA